VGEGEETKRNEFEEKEWVVRGGQIDQNQKAEKKRGGDKTPPPGNYGIAVAQCMTAAALGTMLKTPLLFSR
jgi:hypothetical protein